MMIHDNSQKELKSASSLLDEEGNLVQIGWSRHPLLDCNLENARFYKIRFFQKFRIKRWDYYGITTPTHFFSFTLRFGERKFAITPDTCLGNLDWGRGVWEYKTFWVWASASGFLDDGRRIGLNIGFGFGDTSAATENAIILEGRIHKLSQVDFSYDPNDFMKPWYMSSNDGRVKLEFVLFLERVVTTNLLVVSSEVHQIFGHYYGTIQTDDGENIHIEKIIGFAEEHHARW